MFIVNRLTVHKAIQELGDPAEIAIMTDILQLVYEDLWNYEVVNGLSKKKIATRSSMFLKVKYDALGAFLKVNGRLVGGGYCKKKIFMVIYLHQLLH
jgi:hypothetical protein